MLDGSFMFFLRLVGLTIITEVTVGNVACSHNTIHKSQVFFSLLKNINHSHTPSMALESHPLLSPTH